MENLDRAKSMAETDVGGHRVPFPRGNVPIPSRPGIDLASSTQEACQRWNPLWFYRQVRTGGPWDLKKYGDPFEYDDFGNFHYGAVGTAFGFPKWLLLRGAGWEQWRLGRSQRSWGHPWGHSPYGDDPHDADMIKLGVLTARSSRYYPPIWSRLGWRLFDTLASLVGFVVFSPVMALCVLATVLDSGWPAFNGSWRLGRFGKQFRCWKIRTMVVDHQGILEDWLKRDGDARQCYFRYRKIPNDPRITRVGRILRKLSVDELPQLWNILRGDMSVFGPRPFLVAERHLLSRWEADILAVKPGVVSYYGAHGRSKLTVQQRVRLDAAFANTMHGLGVKWWALKRTVLHCLRRTGAS